jgi:hypothetical protein
MSVTAEVERDERTVSVENASYRLGYFLLYLGVLWDACYRAYFRHEMPFDLLALAIGSGALCTLYQVRQKALTRGRFRKILVGGLIFGVLGAVWALILAWSRS